MSDETDPPDVDVDALVEAKVAEALKDIKGKLDKAYAARDEALGKLKDIEQEKRELEIAKMREEGKHKEAFEAELKAEREKREEEIRRREELEKRNIELTRDLIVKDALSKFPFRNEKAARVAQAEIISDLVRNDKGEWVSKSGDSLESLAEAFATDDSNSFLFKPKQNSGSGGSGPTGSSSGTTKPLSAMTSAEIMKLAEEGKLPTQQ
jgi:hypothetical protein